ncbi:hypothetical protein P3W24_06655 [Luteibacter sp. PPL201]|uniref:Uncharacterized protein n=1 Tax=Luteibacter sahnii TaxID=3021977 RepID=A0ABT6B983_9GAMM
MDVMPQAAWNLYVDAVGRAQVAAFAGSAFAMATSVSALANVHDTIAADLARFEPASTLALIGALLTLPHHQSQCLRLERLVVLARFCCKGVEMATLDDAARWFAAFEDTAEARAEDPAEDVFVTLVANPHGDYRLLEGIWEAAGFYTQCVLDVVDGMPDGPNYRPVKKAIQSMLRLSDLVCARSNLQRYQEGSTGRHAALDTGGLGEQDLRHRVTVSGHAMRKAGIILRDLAPFIMDDVHGADFADSEPGAGPLERRPLVQAGDGIVVMLPTAISVAVRTLVITFVGSTGRIPSFDRALALVHDRLIGEMAILGGPMGARVRWTGYEDTLVGEAAFDADDADIVALRFILPSVAAHDASGFLGMLRPTDSFIAANRERIERAVATISAFPTFQRGLMIQVVCGWGLGFMADAPRINDKRWQVVQMSMADFGRLGSVASMSPEAFWRLHDAEDALRRCGVDLVNLNGPLNLLGWARAHHGHLVPHEQLPEGQRFSPENRLLVHIPTWMLRDVRRDADQGYDRHSAKDNTGRWHRVMRPSASPWFPDAGDKTSYASVDDVQAGRLTEVHEGRDDFWITLDGPAMDRSLLLELWTMLRTWLPGVARALASLRPAARPRRMLKAILVFADDNDISQWTPDRAPVEVDRFCAVEKAREKGAVRVVFRRGFLGAFAALDNRAERAVVRVLTRAFAKLLDFGGLDQLARDAEALIVPDDFARSFHLFQTNSFADSVPPVTGELVVADDIDIAAIRVDLGFRAVGLDHTLAYAGKEACVKVLNSIVDVLINDIQVVLGTLDRTTTVMRLMANCERARQDKQRWTRTSAAVLGLHGTGAGTNDTVALHTSRVDGASVMSRIIVEMAICHCPIEGGHVPTRRVLSQLLALASVLYQIGGVSNAIHLGVLKAELAISPLGDLMFDDDLGLQVVEPMLREASAEAYAAHADQYRRRLRPPVEPPQSDEARQHCFAALWREETDTGVDDPLTLLNILEREGHRRQEPLFVLKRSELVSLGKMAGLTSKTVERILDQFLLPVRPAWDTVPRGFRRNDIYPWTLGRRLSAATRPFIAIDDSDDASVVVAPALVEQSMRYVIDAAFAGRFDRLFFRKPKLWDNWIDDQREGHTFNARVAAMLHAAGWTVRDNIGMAELLQKKLERDHGDVDVLAWREGSREVLIVECKDLAFARNYSEVASQLSAYQGNVVDGEPDKLARHLERVDLVSHDLPAITRLTGVEEPVIVSWLVFRGISPVHFADIAALEGTHVGRASDLVAYQPTR